LEKDPFNGVAGAFSGLGDIEIKVGNYKLAEDYCNEIFNLFGLEKTKYTKEQLEYIDTSYVNAHLCSGKIEMNLSNYDIAIEKFLDSNEILNNTKTQNALGDVYFRDNQLEKSKEHYYKSRSLTNGDDCLSVDANRGLSFVYLALDDKEQYTSFREKAKNCNSKTRICTRFSVFENGHRTDQGCRKKKGGRRQ